MNDPQGHSTRTSTPVVVNGASFVLLADGVWAIPPPSDGGSTTVELSLRITNRSETGLRIYRLDTLRMSLMQRDGTTLQFDGGRNATAPGETVSVVVTPGQSLVISRRAQLAWTKRGTLRLSGSDDFGGMWYFDRLNPGKYQLRFIYEHHLTKAADGAAIWTGEAITDAVEVELK